MERADTRGRGIGGEHVKELMTAIVAIAMVGVAIRPRPNELLKAMAEGQAQLVRTAIAAGNSTPYAGHPIQCTCGCMRAEPQNADAFAREAAYAIAEFWEGFAE